jgi:hypothetical protein
MRIILLAATALLLACGPYRVRLDPPRPDITPEERVKLFLAMRPTATGTFSQDGTVVSNTIFLGDEKNIDDRIEVEAPEDLEPLVGPDSETMQHARASVRARHKASLGEKVTLALLAAGLVTSGGIIGSPPWGIPTKWIGLSMVIGGLAVGWPLTRHWARQELRLRREAFSTYTRDLGARLNVCAHGTQVIPCEAPVDTPGEPPTPPKPPATTVPGRTALLRMR